MKKNTFIDILRHDCLSSRSHVFAFWKLKTLVLEGETYYLPESDCYYSIYHKMLVSMISRHDECGIPAGELNRLDCVPEYLIRVP